MNILHDKKYREKVARLRSAQLELAYRKAPVGFALFDPKDFRLLSLNDNWSEIVGLPSAQLLNKMIAEIVPGVTDLFEMFKVEPEYFKRLLGLLQRLHKRDEFAGTGVGLSICKKILKRHGGVISLQSQFGCATTFYFTMSGAEGEVLQANCYLKKPSHLEEFERLIASLNDSWLIQSERLLVDEVMVPRKERPEWKPTSLEQF